MVNFGGLAQTKMGRLVCETCLKPFQARRTDQRYCSDNCRQNRLGEKEYLRRWMAQVAIAEAMEKTHDEEDFMS